jgi:hypothetical protein
MKLTKKYGLQGVFFLLPNFVSHLLTKYLSSFSMGTVPVEAADQDQTGDTDLIEYLIYAVPVCL